MGGMAIVALSGDPDVLNPLIRRSSSAGVVLAEILDTLTELDEDLAHQPRIASDWTLSDDQKSIVYSLQPWSWEDGVPLTAHDVVASFQCFKDPLIGARNRGFYKDVVEAEALDERTVVYRFQHPLTDPVSRTSHAILPAHLLQNLDHEDVDRWAINQNPLASGPFKLESWEHSHALVLQRNSRYSGTAAHLDRVMLRIIKEPAARVMALEAGEVDFVSNVSPHDARRLAQDPRFSLQKTEGRRFYYLLWNCRDEILEDVSTRKALSLAIDRRRMIETLQHGYAQPAVSPIARVMWNHADELVADPYDPEEARRLLARAGWSPKENSDYLERNGRTLSLEIITKSGDPVRRDGAVIIAENLKKIGVDIKFRSLELAAGMDLVSHGDFQAYFGAMNPNLYGDPSSLVHSSAVDEFNYGFYSNSRVDSLLQVALETTDRQAAFPIWVELQTILQEDQPAAYLFCPQRLDAVSERVRDVRPHVLSPFNNLAEWWIAPEDRKYKTRFGQ